MLRLVGAFGRHAEVVGLFLGELGQLHANAFEVQYDCSLSALRPSPVGTGEGGRRPGEGCPGENKLMRRGPG
jgi:hypothetical protein